MGIEDYEAREKSPAKMKKDVKSHLEEKIHSTLLDRYSDASEKQDISITESYTEFYKIGLGEVAKLLHVHPNTLRRWSIIGLIEYQRRGSRGDRIYLPEYINRLLEEKVYPVLDRESSVTLVEAYFNIYKAYMVKIKDAAKLLHVHTNTLRRWSNKGIIRSYRFGLSGERRFKFADVLKLKKGDQSASLESDKPNSNMLTITEVADILHASENTVRHWADGDSLTCYRIGPRGDRKFDPKDVKDFAEKMGYPKDDIEHLQNYINRTKNNDSTS